MNRIVLDKVLVTVLVMLVAVGFSNSSLAQSTDVASELSVFKVVRDAKGKETFEDTASVKPGDTIEYRLTYTNRRVDPITNLKPILPVPAGTVYLKDSASPKPSGVTLVDNGPIVAFPPTRKVKNDKGKEVVQPVPPEEFRSLQWSVSRLNPGASVTFKARMTINGK